MSNAKTKECIVSVVERILVYDGCTMKFLATPQSQNAYKKGETVE